MFYEFRNRKNSVKEQFIVGDFASFSIFQNCRTPNSSWLLWSCQIDSQKKGHVLFAKKTQKIAESNHISGLGDFLKKRKTTPSFWRWSHFWSDILRETKTLLENERRRALGTIKNDLETVFPQRDEQLFLTENLSETELSCVEKRQNSPTINIWALKSRKIRWLQKSLIP
jgi:hypothetical protein